MNDQRFELDWWGDCTLTWSEEWKQQAYLSRMGVIQVGLGEQWPVYTVSAHSIVDVGGGPVSPLLKVARLRSGAVVDPGRYPRWTADRYAHCGIAVFREPAEEWLHKTESRYDEAWCMNVLQHVVDPKRIIEGMRRVANTIRIFEWLETPPSPGHPHTLHANELDEWLEGQGNVESINENGAVGLSYAGVFDYGSVH